MLFINILKKKEVLLKVTSISQVLSGAKFVLGYIHIILKIRPRSFSDCTEVGLDSLSV